MNRSLDDLINSLSPERRAKIEARAEELLKEQKEDQVNKDIKQLIKHETKQHTFEYEPDPSNPYIQPIPIEYWECFGLYLCIETKEGYYIMLHKDNLQNLGITPTECFFNDQFVINLCKNKLHLKD